MKADLVFIYSNYHNAYWKDNRAGYTDSMIEAGFYEREEAELICAGSDRSVVQEINRDLYNSAINAEVTRLVERMENVKYKI